MKKYIIKDRDGERTSCLPSTYNSYGEAVKALVDYLHEENKYADAYKDAPYISPFEFKIEEEEIDVNEEIVGFYSACIALGIKPNKEFEVNLIGSDDTISLGAMSEFVREINPKHFDALVALNKLFTIAEAWNKEDDFVPDFSNKNQCKYFPWFMYNNDAKSFVFANTAYTVMMESGTFGPRLYFKSESRAEQFGKQFAHLYNKVFLLNK